MQPSDRTVAVAGVLAAVALTAAVSLATDTPTVVGQTWLGVATYLVVGLALPRLVVGRRAGHDTSLGLGALAAVVGLAVAGYGLATGTLLTPLDGSLFVTGLLLLVTGTLVGSAVAAFREGYGASRE